MWNVFNSTHEFFLLLFQGSSAFRRRCRKHLDLNITSLHYRIRKHATFRLPWIPFILLFYPAKYFPLVLHWFDSVPPVVNICSCTVIPPRVSCHGAKRSEQQRFEFKGGQGRAEHIESSRHQWISALRRPSQTGSSRVERTALFPHAWNTPLCGEMHGLPRSATAPLLSRRVCRDTTSPHSM